MNGRVFVISVPSAVYAKGKFQIVYVYNIYNCTFVQTMQTTFDTAKEN